MTLDLQNGSTWRWRQFRLVILERDRWQCQIKGPKCLGRASCVDHIIPRNVGGAIFDEANCRASCKPCNESRVVFRNVGPRLPSREW